MKRNAVAWAALIVSTAALISSRGLTRPVPAAPQIPAEGQRTAKALSQAFEAVADYTRPSVVQISVQRKGGMPRSLGRGRQFPFPMPGPNNPRNFDPKDFEEMLKKFFGPDFRPEKEQFGGPAEGTGSGFVYDDKGHILTNNHVVEGSGKITVTFYDGVELQAKVVGADKQSDVAVIKVDSTSYPALPRGDSNRLKVGEMVMAVGSPFELSQSVTTGIISALDRNAVGINEYESFIQTDAPINRGNSGGPLVNMNGEVVGINSAIVSGGSGNDGIGFAIPIKLAQSVAEMLIKDGRVHYARVGIRLAPLTAPLARQFGLDAGTRGVLVAEVVSGSPADKAGLRQGDVITSFGGEKVLDASSFKLRVATSEVSRTYELGYVRDGKPATTTIVPAPADRVVFDVEREDEGKNRSDKGEPAKTSITAFGLDVQALTSEVIKALGLPAETKGVVVSSVKEGSPAGEAGIQEGDVITKVVHNRRIQQVTGVEQFQSLAGQSDELAIVVQSGKLSRFVTLTKGSK